MKILTPYAIATLFLMALISMISTPEDILNKRNCAGDTNTACNYSLEIKK